MIKPIILIIINNPNLIRQVMIDHIQPQPHHHEHQCCHQANQPVQLPPTNPSHSHNASIGEGLGTDNHHHHHYHHQPRPHHDQQYQTYHHHHRSTDHYQPLAMQPRPVQYYNNNNLLAPPPNINSNWPNNNGPYTLPPPQPVVQPPPANYYPTPPHHHHHHQAAAVFYSAPQALLYPPPAAYQFPHHQPQPPQYHSYKYNFDHSTAITTAGIPMNMMHGIDSTWKTGLFDCFSDTPNAIMTLLCPCWTFGQLAELVDNGQTSCATHSLIYVVIMMFICVPCLISCTYRKKLRYKFDLPEGPGPDCIIHFLCECCALTQEHRELALRGLDPSLGWVRNMEQIQRVEQRRAAVMAPPLGQRMVGY